MRRLLEFHRSPNSVKVRIALEVKRLEYETEEMYSADREPIVAAGGWPLVPILIDGAVRMRESAAILHYLEANYRDAPSLTPASRDEILSAEAILANVAPDIRRLELDRVCLRPNCIGARAEGEPERGKGLPEAGHQHALPIAERHLPDLQIELGARELALCVRAPFDGASALLGRVNRRVALEGERDHRLAVER